MVYNANPTQSYREEFSTLREKNDTNGDAFHKKEEKDNLAHPTQTL
jgi:hypothetical protein